MVYRIAVLYEAVQLSDVVPGIDLFSNASRKTMDMLAADADKIKSDVIIPPHIASQAIDMEFLYVSSTLEPSHVDPYFKITPTHTYENCPRDVDVVLVGGPMLSHRPAASMQFFRDIFEKGKKGVVFMTTCVGAVWVADSGVLKGKKATTNRMLLQFAQKLHPEVEWVDKRWVVEEMDHGKGEIWTRAGCGIDMIASFIEQRLPHPISVWSRLGLDFDPHVQGQEYKEPIEKTFAQLASVS